MVFIVEDQGRFNDITALFKVTTISLSRAFSFLLTFANDEKDGQVRLELPEGHGGFHTWDTPNPPPLPPVNDPQASSQISLYGSLDVPTRFYTIDMFSITGLTFFFAFGGFYATHAHTGTEPATIPPECLLRRVQDGTTWNYIPIPADDQVLAIGLRVASNTGPLNGHCLLVRYGLAS